MIITSSIKLEIGKIYSNENPPVPNLPFMYLGEPVERYSFKVINETDYVDFLLYVRDTFPDMYSRIKICKYFYEIQTD